MRILSLLLLLPFSPGNAEGAAHSSLLQQMQDRFRPVLLFAGDADPRADAQYNELRQHAVELRERQMRIVLVTRTPTAAGASTPAGTVAAIGAEADALRARFHVAAGTFALLLVGKDGGEKFRGDRPVPFETLRRLVDAMPMRQQEMHAR